MPASVKVSGTYRQLSGFYRTGGVWKSLLVFTRVGGTWRSVNPLTGSVDTTSVSGSAANPGPAFSGFATAAGSGGTGSYTYTWEYVSGDTGIFIAASGASVRWGKSNGVPGNWSAGWRCKITDGVSTVYTSTVNISLTLT